MSISNETIDLQTASVPASQSATAISNEASDDDYEVVIKPRSGWQLIDWKEFVEYRDLFWFLIWKRIKVQYAQSALGIGWALVKPVCTMLVFTVVFGMLAKIDSDGAPYAVFSLVALVPWTYFSSAVSSGTNSLLTNANMLSKVYFPRMMLPLSDVLAQLVDFAVSLVILVALMVFYRISPNAGVLVLPLLVGIMVLSATGLGLWLTALAVHYRDVKFAITFLLQLMMYLTPVVYPSSLVPQTYSLGRFVIYPRLIYSFNPMVGVIEGFRSALLGTIDMPWMSIAVGGLSSVVMAVTGCLYFRKKERLFADVA